MKKQVSSEKYHEKKLEGRFNRMSKDLNFLKKDESDLKTKTIKLEKDEKTL